LNIERKEVDFMGEEQNKEKKLFLLDGYALIYRAYFAFIKNPRINSKGENTSAAFGFTNLVLDILKKHKPTHIAVAFDPAETPSERNELFEAYKANREAMPEDIRSSLPQIRRILNAMRIPVLMEEGYEADDVVGTLAKQAEAMGFITYMVTSDKDYGQLVSNKTFWYKPGRMGNPDEVLGIEEVCAKFDVSSPAQVIDLLGLMGDSADNIPGIPGVGEKTAIKYLKDYGSVEGLIAHAHELKGKAKERVEEHAELARLSKLLATIQTDVPVVLDEKELRVEEFDRELLQAVFAELEFRTLADRVLGNGSQPLSVTPSKPLDLFSVAGEEVEAVASESELNSLDEASVCYYIVTDPQWRKQLVEKLLSCEEVCFDTETDSLEALNANLVGFSFAVAPGLAWYIPCPDNRNETIDLLQEFAQVFSSNTILKIGQNLKYDLQVLKNYGVEWSGPAFDTMLAHYLIQPEGRHNLDYLANTYLNYSPISTESLIGPKGKNQLTMRQVEIEKVGVYCNEDTDITLQLKQVFAPRLHEEGLSQLFEQIEMPLFPVLTDMEREGVAIDSEFLADMGRKLAVEIEMLDRTIQEMAGYSFNTGSPKQLGEILFDRLKLDDKAKKTRTGQYSTNEETLQKLVGKHPIIDLVLDLRELQKLKSTYVDALPALINPQTGRVHTHYNQTGAATGRLSSSNPNLQNIPIRTPRGQEIRRAFIPRDDNHVLLCADYSQVELRIIAELSGDKAMQDDFLGGLDIHAATAARVFGVPLNEVDKNMRGKAKMVNFGIIYGISPFGLSQRLAISRTEAKEIIDAYFEKYSGIRQYMDAQIEFARKHGYVETLMARRRYLRDIHSANQTVRGFAERNAINAPIQGSSADIIKKAMINIHAALSRNGMKSKMVLQVHDELVFDALKSEVEELRELVIDCMENAHKTLVPLKVDAQIGDNWLEAK
jgi:DNA polymerase I